MPLATIGTAICQISGIEDPDPLWFNPAAQQLLAQQAKEEIDPEAARQFLREVRAGLVPSWVLEQADFQLIEAAAS